MSAKTMHAAGGGETHLFVGEPKVFFLAHCQDCWPDRWAPMPFATGDERDKWAGEHATTGHEIARYVEIRC